MITVWTPACVSSMTFTVACFPPAGELFEYVQLCRSGREGLADALHAGDGVTTWWHQDDGDVTKVEDGEDRYRLLLVLRVSAVDAETLRPIGQAMPVEWFGQYPPGFFCKYCWW
jgi:hypothetical protein